MVARAVKLDAEAPNPSDFALDFILFEHAKHREMCGALDRLADAAGVSLALLHGSQPDVIVLCHDPARTHVLGYPAYPLPDLKDAIQTTLHLGARTNPAIRCAGVSLNTSPLSEREALALMERTSAEIGLPAADPIRGGDALEALVDACLGNGNA